VGSDHSPAVEGVEPTACTPRPSVVIPARDAAADLAVCLSALGAGSLRPFEVIVVDDASADDTPGVAAAHGARVVRGAGSGPAAARNLGARAASGDLIVFFDADCAPEPSCLAALVAPFADPGVAGVRGGYTTDQRALVARFVQLELEEKQERLAASREVAVVDTACAAYRRDVFLAAGGFDDRFPATSAEDVELSFRLVEEGHRLVFAPSARVRHRHPDQLGRYLWRKARFGYYRALVYRRYPSRMREDGYTPRLMPVQIGLAGVLSLSLLAGPWLAGARVAAGAASLAFLATSLPLARRAARHDAALATWVPALLLARSVAQGLGLALGLGSLVLQQAFPNRAKLGHRPARLGPAPEEGAPAPDPSAARRR
jgi:GT2 family glycosyltransferase